MKRLSVSELATCMGRKPVYVDRYVDAFNAEMVKHNIATPRRMAAFLAQVGHESAGLLYWEELASGKAYTDRADLGNTQPEAIAIARAHGMDTGPFFKGHGFIQITGYTNHLAYSIATYKDNRCAQKPKLLTLSPDCVGSACWFWNSRKLSALADKGTDDSFKAITQRINGGYNGLDDRRQRWTVCKNVLGD